MKGKNYNVKSILQMILKEGYYDRNEIANELGITRGSVTRIISSLDPDDYEKVIAKMEQNKKNKEKIPSQS